MTAGDQFGPSVGRGMIRRWVLEGLRLWMPDYIRNAERQEGYPAGRAELPRSFPVAPDLRKMPEQAIPAVVVQIPGLSDQGAHRMAKGEVGQQWIVALSGLVHGRDAADTEALADVYGLALRLLMLQQVGNFVTTPGYAGPPLDVELVTYADEGYDDLPWRRSRTLVAATATFRVDIRGTAQMAGPLTPSLDPLNPEAWPEVTSTELQIDRMEG